MISDRDFVNSPEMKDLVRDVWRSVEVVRNDMLVIAERARTSHNMRPVTKVNASMSRSEIIAKILNSGKA
jgi:hypothetical protein